MQIYDGNNAPMSLQDQLRSICLHKSFKVVTRFQVMVREKKDEEWIPHGLFETRPIAEYFEKRIKNDFRFTCIIAVDYYKMPLFAHGVHHHA